MLAARKKCLVFLTPRQRWQWAGFIPLTMTVALLEALGAALVLWFIKLISAPPQFVVLISAVAIASEVLVVIGIITVLIERQRHSPLTLEAMPTPPRRDFLCGRCVTRRYAANPARL